MKHFQLLAVAVLAVTFAGCSAATQNIPVSSTPTGAQVLSDGESMCMTPCNVKLKKTQAHILTLKKSGYKDANVQIQRTYDTGKVTRDAIQTGAQQSSWGASAEGAVANALLGVSTDEETGNAYVLSPSSVVVTMVPEGQAGKAKVTTASEAKVDGTAPATMASGLEEHPEEAAEAALEGAAAAAPTIGTKKNVEHSHHSSTHMNDDGSYTKKSSSTSASVGVSVNPAEAGLGLLHLLEGESKKSDDSDDGSDSE